MDITGSGTLSDLIIYTAELDELRAIRDDLAAQPPDTPALIVDHARGEGRTFLLLDTEYTWDASDRTRVEEHSGRELTCGEAVRRLDAAIEEAC